jgi:type IV pilus assembly protein PilE
LAIHPAADTVHPHQEDKDVNVIDVVNRRGSPSTGFTLIELIIVISIISLLVALAVPAFSDYVRKGKRAEAQQLLMNWANLQEIWRANNPTYADADDIAAPTHDDYTFTVTNVTATSYTLTADPTGNQVKDKDQGLACDPLTLNQSGDRTPTKTVDGQTQPVCWGRH